MWKKYKKKRGMQFGSTVAGRAPQGESGSETN